VLIIAALVVASALLVRAKHIAAVQRRAQVNVLAPPARRPCSTLVVLFVLFIVIAVVLLVVRVARRCVAALRVAVCTHNTCPSEPNQKATMSMAICAPRLPRPTPDAPAADAAAAAAARPAIRGWLGVPRLLGISSASLIGISSSNG
jgi:hypothetical protein